MGNTVIGVWISLLHSCRRTVYCPNYSSKPVKYEEEAVLGRIENMKRVILLSGLLIGFVVALVSGWLFHELGESISNPLVESVDDLIVSLVAGEREADETRVMLFITQLASWPVVLVVSLLFLGLLLRLHQRTHAMAFLITGGGAAVLIFLLKAIYGRPRPANGPLVTEQTLSFPSGHVFAAVVIYGFIAYILAHSARRWYTKVLIWLVYVTLFVAIGVSRVYIGVHYVTDVTAGLLAGTSWLITGIFTLLYLEHRFTRGRH